MILEKWYNLKQGICESEYIAPKVRCEKYWSNKRADGQTDTKVHNLNIWETTYMKIKKRRCKVLEE